jgi:hypothetical protein
LRSKPDVPLEHIARRLERAHPVVWRYYEGHGDLMRASSA